MVIAHSDKAGQYSKSNAARAYLRPLLWCLTGLVLFVAAAGFLVGLTIGKAISWIIGIPSLLVLLGGMLQLTKLMDKRMAEAGRERLRWLRGGQAEAWVSLLFRDSDLSDDYHLFDNLKLDANSDLDHVLIGPAGLFVISTKAHRGHFRLAPGGPSPPSIAGNTNSLVY